MDCYFQNTKNLIEKYNVTVENLNLCDKPDEKDIEVLEFIDVEMAKALISDWDQCAVKIAKIILAHDDIGEIKVRFE